MFISKRKVLKLINQELERLQYEEDQHYKAFITDTESHGGTYEAARYMQASRDRLKLQNIKNQLE